MVEGYWTLASHVVMSFPEPPNVFKPRRSNSSLAPERDQKQYTVPVGKLPYDVRYACDLAIRCFS
jgi:hypothetical protein